jgi:hypothetical protein
VAYTDGHEFRALTAARMDDLTYPPDPDRPPPSRLRVALLRVLLPLVIIGVTVAALVVLHLDGTLRDFLDRQSMGGMIVVVLTVNIVGFVFIYMLSQVWKTVKYDLFDHRES